MANFLTSSFLIEEHASSEHFDDSQGCQIELIEVWPNGNSRRTLLDEKLVREYVERDFSPPPPISTGIPNSRPQKAQETLRLFFSNHHGKYTGSMLPLPISATLFKRLRPFARIAEHYIETLTYKIAFNTRSRPHMPKVDHRGGRATTAKEYLCFVIQPTPAWLSMCYSASFTFHFPTRELYIFMHTEPDQLVHRLPNFLQHNTQSLETYLLIPALMLKGGLEYRNRCLNEYHDQIYQYETKLKIRTDAAEGDPDVNFTQLARNLNAVTTHLAFAKLLCGTDQKTLIFLDDVASKYRELATENGLEEDEAQEIEQLLTKTHAHLRDWNESIERRTEYLQKRGQALVQTMYSSIAQRDSASNLSLASTSTRLAETSQDLAISTSRDSAVMRVIAAITIFFLPATFTATFFSTSFFDFHGGKDDKIYSWWLWLYFVVTLVLTVVVVVGTALLWKNKEKEIATRFARIKEE